MNPHTAGEHAHLTTLGDTTGDGIHAQRITQRLPGTKVVLVLPVHHVELLHHGIPQSLPLFVASLTIWCPSFDTCESSELSEEGGSDAEVEVRISSEVLVYMIDGRRRTGLPWYYRL